jgi:hypothetical protein
MFNRLVLVPEPRRQVPEPRLRRYRLARLDLREEKGPDRHAHLRRVYD